MPHKIGHNGYLAVEDIWAVLHWDTQVTIENMRGFVYWKGECMDVFHSGYREEKVIYIVPCDKGIRLTIKSED